MEVWNFWCLEHARCWTIDSDVAGPGGFMEGVAYGASQAAHSFHSLTQTSNKTNSYYVFYQRAVDGALVTTGVERVEHSTHETHTGASTVSAYTPEMSSALGRLLADTRVSLDGLSVINAATGAVVQTTMESIFVDLDAIETLNNDPTLMERLVMNELDGADYIANGHPPGVVSCGQCKNTTKGCGTGATAAACRHGNMSVNEVRFRHKHLQPMEKVALRRIAMRKRNARCGRHPNTGGPGDVLSVRVPSQ
jgi:hypothetical protein